MKTMSRLWTTLEAFTTPAAVLAEWQAALGPEFPDARVYLRPTQDQARTYPCINLPQCDCRHEIVTPVNDGTFRAVCHCDLGNCPPLLLQPRDILIHELDTAKLGDAIRQAFGFDRVPSGAICSAPRSCRIGTCGPVQSPVYFTIPTDETGFLGEIEGLCTAIPTPFLLVTPTHNHYTPTIEGTLKRHRCALIPLLQTLALSDNGRLQVTNPIDSILADFDRHMAESGDTKAVLKDIHREIAAVRKDYHDLRTAKDRLEQMLNEGLFAFTKKVDSRSFKIFCTILADGDVAKASRTLNMGDSTLRDVLKSWRGQGKAYMTMLDLVRWRKKIGRKVNLPLNDAILHEKADTADYPALIADLLDGLLSMTAENWDEKCEELTDLLRPHVPR